MSYCSPDRELGYLDSPEFFSTLLHTFGFVAIPMHLFGGWCILFRTPSKMRTAKWSLFNFQFWTCFLDLAFSFMTTPFILIPFMAGYPLGVLKYTGMSTANQTYFMVTLVAITAMSIVIIFENRFLILSQQNHRWRRIRIPWFILNYVITFIFFYPVYYMIPVNQVQWKAIVLEKLPCLTEEVRSSPILVLTEKARYLNTCAGLQMLFIFSQIFWLFFQIHRSFKEYGVNHSKRTIQLQRQFMRALSLQVAIPCFILAFPILYIGFAAGFKWYHQYLNNFCMFLLSSHGFLSTIAILAIHAPYREVVVDIVTCGRGPLRIKDVRSNSASVQPTAAVRMK